MAERSRRERNRKEDKFEALRRARQGGSRSWKAEEDVDIYDEVTDDQYKSIVRGRLARDDFVVDDGIGGYNDNGMDDWSEGQDEEQDSEEEIRKKGKKKQTKERDDAKGKKPKAPPQASVAPSISSYRPVVSAEQETDFMSALLGDMDTIAATTITRPSTKPSRKRKPSPSCRNPGSSSPAYRNDSSYGYADTSSDGPVDLDLAETGGFSSSGDEFERVMSPKKKVKTGLGVGVTPAIKKMEKMDVNGRGNGRAGGKASVKMEADDDFYDDAFDTAFDDSDMSAFMDVDLDEELKGVDSKSNSTKKTERGMKMDVDLPFKPLNGASSITAGKKKLDDTPGWLSVYDSLTVEADDSGGLGSATTSVPSSSTISPSSILEPDGSLRFFWLDYLEVDGRLYFTGKVVLRPQSSPSPSSPTYISCCITVENLQRSLFVLPRERQMEADEQDNFTIETDVVPGLKDVYDDFDRVRKKVGIKSWKAKFVKRLYAFGEEDVPRGEKQWLKVVYGFDEPQIPLNVSSPNFSRVFGTNTSAFELLVLKRKIMGPCWLQIKKPRIENKGVSWCKVEATVSDPKDFNPFSETDQDAPKDIPPLTVMSLSIRTIVNHKENKREIVCATARTWANIQIDDPTPPESLPCTSHTFVRPLDRFPPNFEIRAKANGKGSISPMKNERMLLNNLLVTLHKADPDVLVGHEFLGVSLDVLLHRMRELKADHWSRIGRFRRVKWPNVGKQGTNLKFLNGRLLCDLASDGAKSMIASTTWSLTEMCQTHLKSDRQDIDPDDTASYFDGSVSTPERLLTFVRHCELDAHYHMAIAAKVQILPLTKQLTGLAGNSWNKTLNGGRAERNEYILLHEFHRLKYICPDKFWGKKVAPKVVEVPDDEEGGAAKTTTKGKRDKYKGGLVFEPKRGLWDKFILVMDFNSLYPSIIQEYNIDFTTVENDGEEKIPEPPSSDVPQGVLPRLIATLVQRRRQVKSLMKDRSLTPAKLLQYDIKQQALKLTANSMYGCLGFEHSRFYARPLAALTTYKGREILTHTRELAESLQLDVVYGDTDSVFVNSNVTELADALKISAEFKKAVNDRYKLLEIDLDSVFKRLLLLQKKKYAAIKVEDGTRTSTEVKGLDMKRREFCALSKNVSQYVLEQILSGDATETVVERIHEYLTTIGENVREGKIKVDEFIVFKRLGKNPEDYPDAKSQPHVQVALRMKSKGGNARSGDVIPYIFCLGTDGETAKTGQADRARHPDEVHYEFYLAHQVLPPIERLCEPIEGTDRSRLAECLGLDPNRYRSTGSGESEERYFSTLDSQISDSERYRDCTPFTVRCASCQGEMPFAPVNDRDSSLLYASGPACIACQSPLSPASIHVQLETQIRGHIAKYYEGWTVCDDTTCGNRTRMARVYAKRCLKSGCRGSVTFVYSDSQLYNQLRFYSSLFNQPRILKLAKGSTSFGQYSYSCIRVIALMAETHLDAVNAIVATQGDLLAALEGTVEKYLDQCGRRWVELGGLFSFMKL
ncbi:hypothetical protein JAAARDRAFT_74363 [Jaapia argillacea MUCL 33604]|uniref:DNA polymerase n=1 Tax=Jaapia argillacea MUCL 33604 TaxID=933084 RepID=A0A067P8J8_9AGAM|nr:hypothetical protein JAAARDRAFT_74363 [Jaapia argillacea MUCL 33604]